MKQDPGSWFSLPASLRQRITAISTDRGSVETPITQQSRMSCKKSLKFPRQDPSVERRADSPAAATEGYSQQASSKSTEGQQRPKPTSPTDAPEVLKIAERVVFGKQPLTRDNATASSVHANGAFVSDLPPSNPAGASETGAVSWSMQGCVQVLNDFMRDSVIKVSHAQLMSDYSHTASFEIHPSFVAWFYAFTELWKSACRRPKPRQLAC